MCAKLSLPPRASASDASNLPRSSMVLKMPSAGGQVATDTVAPASANAFAIANPNPPSSATPATSARLPVRSIFNMRGSSRETHGGASDATSAVSDYIATVRDRLMRAGVRAMLHNRALVWMLARGRTTGRDVALDRQVAAILEAQRIGRLPALDSMTPEAARRYAEEGLSPLDLPATPMA